jgi:hypothetical protein
MINDFEVKMYTAWTSSYLYPSSVITRYREWRILTHGDSRKVSDINHNIIAA